MRGRCRAVPAVPATLITRTRQSFPIRTQHIYHSLPNILRRIVSSTYPVEYPLDSSSSVFPFTRVPVSVPNPSVPLPVISTTSILQPCSAAGVPSAPCRRVWLSARLPADSSNPGSGLPARGPPPPAPPLTIRVAINQSIAIVLVCGHLCRAFGSTLS